MTTVGILGGGQLARMMALSGAPLGLRFLLMDSTADACAGQFAPMVVGDYRDEAALGEFAQRIDCATFDFENVPAESAAWLSQRVPVFPSPRALAVAQDRMEEKSLFNRLGIATPAFCSVDSRASLDSALERIGVPAILKTRRLGYDGKGQFRIRPLAGTQDRIDPEQVDEAWDALGAQADGVGLILEGFIAFQRELSVLSVRGRDGGFRTWPITENWHESGVLSLSLAPAHVSEELARRAIDHARRIAEELDYVGVFALELFERSGELLANEMAPRVHNSGHWTIEGAETSQFQNHLRAVLGMPLGSTAALGVSCMLNWIGVLPESAPVLAQPGGHWHDYGKQAREGRKVGHATLRADAPPALADALSALGRALQRDAQVAPAIARLRELR